MRLSGSTFMRRHFHVAMMTLLLAIGPVGSVGRAQPAPIGSSGAWILDNVSVIDTRSGRLAPSRSILIDGGRIVRVASSRDLRASPVRRIDGNGAFVVPGYNDMHAHPLNPGSPEGGLQLMLANGITGFRQMSGSPELLYLDNKNAVALGVFQRPGSNALATPTGIKATMEELKKSFPPGVDYTVVYNPTEFIQASVDAVIETLFEALILVVIVVILFLQTWRAAIIPLIAIPVSLIGAFAVMSAVGLSFNTLSLFGLVLAIGIVVDDAIVVVENVERYLTQGMSPKEAAHKTMDEVGGALIAISLVLIAVFLPTAFISGLQGSFYKQFAITIAASTAISAFVSLTLSPALAALLLKTHALSPVEHARPTLGDRLAAPLNWFSGIQPWLRMAGAISTAAARRG